MIPPNLSSLNKFDECISMPWFLFPINKGLFSFLDLFNLFNLVVFPLSLRNIGSEVFFAANMVSGK